MTDDQAHLSIAFALVDVFADRPLSGNPVAVVADAGGLTEETMRRIAREFNQSETTFVLPPTRDGADYRIRAFTPAGKEAFGAAGHHTLGTWWWLAETGALPADGAQSSFMQEDGDHLVPVNITWASGRPVSVAMSQGDPEFGQVCTDLVALADALGLSVEDIDVRTLPAQVVSTGAAHLLVPLRTRTAVTRAQPDTRRLGALLHAIGGEGCYLHTRETVDAAAAAHARFFNPTLGIIEDVATGTAAGPLACLLRAHGLAPPDGTVRIEQGYALGRPSVIEVRLTGQRVSISGRCVVAGHGTLRVEGGGVR